MSKQRKNWGAPGAAADEVEQLRLLVREAHGAIKDLRDVIKQGEQLAVVLRGLNEAIVREEISETMETEITKVKGYISTTMDACVQQIKDEFAIIAQLLTNSSEENLRNGEMTLYEAAAYVAGGGSIKAKPAVTHIKSELEEGGPFRK